jgi:protein kinase-like protein
MGTVYLAHDPVIHRNVAIKVVTIRPDLSEEEARQYRERFLREAQAAGALIHPNIVGVHDIGQDPATGRLYIVMEHVAGQDLKKMILSQAPLQSGEAVRLVLQIATALDYAHRRGIVHRDVKPANVLISERGQVKITDFGVARLPGSDLTRSDQFVGSPGYMSPEQLKGGAVDGRSDLFALGVILYQLLTGRSPFEGENVSEVLYKISTQPADPPSEIHPDVSADFDPILEKALSKDPADRYQTGKEMIEALRVVSEMAEGTQTESAGPAAGGAAGEEDGFVEVVPTSPWWTLRSQWRLGVLVTALLLTLVGVNWAIHRLVRGALSRPGTPQGSLAVVGAPLPAMSGKTPPDKPIPAICARTYADPVEIARVVAATRKADAFGFAADGHAARIRLELSHRLPSGRVIVRVDGKTVLSKPFDSSKGTKKSLSHLLSVPAGRHGVEVRLLDGKGNVEAASKIAGTVARDRVAVLRAEQKSGLRKTLDLAWASRENRAGGRVAGRASH